MQVFKIIVSIFIFLILLNGCLPQPPCRATSIAKSHLALQEGILSNRNLVCCCKPPCIPRAVNNALLPAIQAGRSAPIPPNERRFDIAVNNMPAKDFFMGLIEGTPYNMVIDPNLAGVISLKLKQVTIDEAMLAVRDVYGYNYKITPYGYEILPQALCTQIFNVNYIDVLRSGKTVTQVASGQISQKVGAFVAGAPAGIYNQSAASPQPIGETLVKTESEMAFWRTLEINLRTLIGNANNRSVIVNPSAGVVVVRAFPNEIRQVACYLDRLQCNLSRQVIIEAKILEVTLDDDFRSGIDWNLFGKGNLTEGGIAQHGTRPFPGTQIRDLTDNIFTLNIKGDFGAVIHLLQRQGQVQVLSSPRISAVNNQKAVIKVGEDEFFVTGVSTSNYIASNTTIPTQDVSLTPFFSGITLDVTPQISRCGDMILHIHPAISAVREQEKNIQLGSTTGTTPNVLRLPLALSTIRESDNIVRAKNGQVIVIGGLMQNVMREDIAGTPSVSKIPFIGTFFRRTQQLSNKTELVILLRPVIVERKSLIDDMEETDVNFRDMHRGFHIGGLPEVFGTEGEKPT